jgi:hypothetical protein
MPETMIACCSSSSELAKPADRVKARAKTANDNGCFILPLLMVPVDKVHLGEGREAADPAETDA